MTRQLYLRIERVIMLLMVLGLIGMFQPWAIELYGWGFHLLLVSTLAFIIFSKFQPQE
jgi:hypothetical protein